MRYVPILFLLTQPGLLFAQYNNLTFREISIEEGLSQSIVYSIIQDRKGFVWFGTEDGLNRYDGYNFTILRHDHEDPNSLSYNEVRSIYIDSSDVIWIGTFYGGLNKYDPHTQRFTHYQNYRDDPHSLSHNNIKAIIESRDGSLWIGTDGGLNRFDKESERFVRYSHEEGNPRSLSHNVIRALYEDASGILWIATEDGLNRFDKAKETFTVYRHEPSNPNSLSHNMMTALCESRDGFLWVGTYEGLCRFDRDKMQVFSYRHQPDDPGSISHNEISTIYEDRAGVLWIGTNGGGVNLLMNDKNSGGKVKFIRYRNDPQDTNSLSHDEIYAIYEDQSGTIWLGTYGGGTAKVENMGKQFVHYKPESNDPNSLPHEIVWSMYEDPSGILWIGTHGGGLTRLDRVNERYTHYQYDPENPYSISHNIVRLVYPDPTNQDVLWIGTNGGGVNKFNKRTGRFQSYLNDPDDPMSLSHNEIRSMYIDRSGVLWVGTNGGGLNRAVMKEESSKVAFVRYRHDSNDPGSLSNDFVRAIHEVADEAGETLWIGTQGGGLNKFDRRTQTFMCYRADPNNPNGLNNDYILTIYEDSTGIFWLGTWGGGVNRFDRENERFVQYTMQDGLPNNQIYGILEDDGDNLWISTNNGLSKFNPRAESFKNFNVNDGLQSNEFNGGSFFKSHSGEMFFGGIRGFNAFFPENIKDNPHIPPVVITSFRKFNEEVRLRRPISDLEQITLSYKDYVFSFEFAALDYTSPLKNRYAYMMEGLDEEWIYTYSEKRFATYTTLAPGKYVFRVKGSNNDGVWNEEGTEIKVVITPPFWKTLWFRLLGAIVILSLGYVLYKERFRNVRMKTELQSAHDAQMSIMPQVDPKLDNYDISGICIPANEVGGDFFDYFWLGEEKTKFGVAVGDVSGKAMQAAMTAVMTSGMVYLKAGETASVSEIISRLSRPMYLKTDKKMFTALCLASFDVPKKEMTFTNAGLIEPLLKSDQSTSFIETVGLKHPLGFGQNVTYEEKTVQLVSGDVIVLLSDGVPEARNSSKEFYGEKRLKSLVENMDTSQLSSKEINEKIINDIRHFSGKTLQHDDMTLVVVKVL